jgi:hypothetical protein
MELFVIIPCSFSLESLSQNRFHQPPYSLFNEGSKHHSVKILRMVQYSFMEVKYDGNTQITHIEETEKQHRVICLISSFEKLVYNNQFKLIF